MQKVALIQEAPVAVRSRYWTEQSPGRTEGLHLPTARGKIVAPPRPVNPLK